MNAETAWIVSEDLAAYVRARGGVLTIGTFDVLIGWAESGWLSLGFGLVLFLTVIGTIAYLARVKVFQAVKMGEAL